MRQQYEVPPKGCMKKLPRLSRVEQRKRKQTVHQAPHAADLLTQVLKVLIFIGSKKSCEHFRPVPLFFSFLVCSLVGEVPSPPQQQQQAAAVSTQHLRRHRHRRSAWAFAALKSLSQPPPSLSAQLLILLPSHRINEPQSTCILAGVALQCNISKEIIHTSARL